MKNVRLSLVMLWVLGLVIMNASVNARISSRIEGSVTDKDTGNPIPKAWVLLYRLDKGIVASTQTDEKGNFKFQGPPVFTGKQYYVRCTARGYAQYIPEYYFEAVQPAYFDEIFKPFLMEEGQIRHIRLNLERGGSLKGVLNKKDAAGVSPFAGVTVFLRKKKKPAEYFLMETTDKKRFRLGYTKTDELGRFIFHELEPSDDSIPDEYIIELDKKGYNLSIIRGITIKKGKDNILEYTVDLYNSIDLEGNITIGGELPAKGEVILNSQWLSNQGEEIFISSKIEKNGSYSFKGILPGRYKLYVVCFDSKGKIFEETKFIEIEDDKSRVIDMHFGVEK